MAIVVGGSIAATMGGVDKGAALCAQTSTCSRATTYASRGWSRHVYMAVARAKEAKNGVNIVYVIRKEGTQVSFTQLAIPADTPHPTEAHEFLDYLIARVSHHVFDANGNKAPESSCRLNL